MRSRTAGERIVTDLAEVVAWFAGSDTGLSSKAIASHMTTGECDGSYPHDPADLGRCLRLLEQFPEWNARMPEMGRYGTTWAAYAANWEALRASMEAEVGIDWAKGRSAPLTYDLMHKVEADGWRADDQYECSFDERGHLRWAHLRRA